MKTRYAMTVVLLVLLAASLAQATPPEVQLDNDEVVFLMEGAPTNWQNLPWSDQVLHSAPVMDRGLAPAKVRPGYEVISLSPYDWRGRKVYCYIGWTSRTPEGKKIWMRIRPNEVVEARRLIQVKPPTQPGMQEGWVSLYDNTDMRWIRCGNPGGVAAFKFVPIYTQTVPGPERVVEVPRPYPVPQPYGIPYPVYQDRLVYTAVPVWTPTPHSTTYVVAHRGVIGGLFGIGAAYAGRSRISITATGGSANSSSAASASNVNDIDNVNINENTNNNQMQQQQQ